VLDALPGDPVSDSEDSDLSEHSSDCEYNRPQLKERNEKRRRENEIYRNALNENGGVVIKPDF
jgi:hypothetical protein